MFSPYKLLGEPETMNEIFIEAENFGDKGGWITDAQSMETIHSSYIMAHGMGIPVADAKTKITAQAAGKYNVWVLTRNWSAVWNKKTLSEFLR